MLHIVISLILIYLGLCVTFLGAVLVMGLLGREELILPGFLAKPIRLLAWPWLRGWATGITIGYGTVFLVPDPHEMLKTHEATHRDQSRARAAWLSSLADHRLPWGLCLVAGALVQGVCYGWEFIRHGYIKNKFEVAARKAAGEE